MQIGSITAPDRICAPISDPFSMSETMPSFGRELFQADGGRKTRGAATDDNDVMFDAFPLLSQVHHYLSQLVAAFVGLRRRKFLVGCGANPSNDAGRVCLSGWISVLSESTAAQPVSDSVAVIANGPR